MTLPGTPSLVFLAYLFAFLPWAALRSARRLHLAREAAPESETPSRLHIWIGSLVMQAVLLFLAWQVGSEFGFQIFAAPRPAPLGLAAAAAALAACFGLRALIRTLRSEEERRGSVLYRIAPRTPGEHVIWTATVLLASVAEEAAYRGVGFSILWYTFGDPWLAAGLSALAFALAHAIQGWKSGVVVFVIALVMQALVAVSGTLVLAMVVHAAYDLIAGHRIGIEARQLDAETAANTAR